jgi:hypothetical protein
LALVQAKESANLLRARGAEKDAGDLRKQVEPLRLELAKTKMDLGKEVEELRVRLLENEKLKEK